MRLRSSDFGVAVWFGAVVNHPSYISYLLFVTMAMLRLALSCLLLQPGLSDDEDDFPGLFDYANYLPGLVNEEDGLQPGLSDEEDDVLSIPDDDGLAEDVVQFFEQLGPMDHKERLKLMKASFGIPCEPQCYCDVDLLPECTRDLRHVGDQVWHRYYRMNKISETDLPPMRYTQCKGTRCFHQPTPILQIFNMKLQSCQADLTGPIDVYGIVAVRDGEDYCRNYLFNRSRENPLDISNTDGHILLLSPKRGMSMKFNCLLEVDIRMKTIENDKYDKTLVNGCLEFYESRVSFETFFRHTMRGPFGCAVFDMIIFRMGVEATIQLDFLDIPQGWFSIQMCGYTTIGKNFYDFIGENCEFDSIISSVGRLPRSFVAAMQMGDNFLVDFMEGNTPLVFKSTLHGTEEKEYSFQNGAMVSVKVSWSTAFFGG
ncbi:hypothetical protein EJB05_09970 [Eragrostis curvula]|uniref:DUF6598 domain-containing protein n=1 Tax=Eragrostis curvula TaxID=38414 RepID=A0A5J9W7R9_9POAL|nr:hypothetical protein EJB05_09970 [Eragrostis curvula]